MPDLVCFSSEFFCIACRLHVDINTSGSRCSTCVLKTLWNQNVWHVVQCICLILTIHKLYLWCTVFVLDKLRRILITRVALHRFVSNQTQVACHGILMIKGKDKRSFDVLIKKWIIKKMKKACQTFKAPHCTNIHWQANAGNRLWKHISYTWLLLEWNGSIYFLINKPISIVQAATCEFIDV